METLSGSVCFFLVLWCDYSRDITFLKSHILSIRLFDWKKFILKKKTFRNIPINDWIKSSGQKVVWRKMKEKCVKPLGSSLYSKSTIDYWWHNKYIFKHAYSLLNNFHKSKLSF